MKRTTLVILLCVFACHMHKTLAQQNWWEISQDGNPTIASARQQGSTNTVTTQSPSTSSTRPCGCVPTNQYNPVCGDNKVTYMNSGELECARSCGTNVALLFYGRCAPLS